MWSDVLLLSLGFYKNKKHVLKLYIIKYMYNNFLFKIIMKYLVLIFLIINIIGMIGIIFEPFIGSIILIFSGFITYISPKMIYKKGITSISHIRIGSLFIFLGGIINLIFIKIMPQIIFYTDIGYSLQIALVTFIFIGIGFPVEGSTPTLAKNNNSFTRNTIESIIIVSLVILSFACAVYIGRFKPFTIIFSYILFFIGFLIMICPNALDVKRRTKSSYLLIRIFGMMVILMAIINYIIISFNRPFVLGMVFSVILYVGVIFGSVLLIYLQKIEKK